jgi:hypothetical protein
MQLMEEMLLAGFSQDQVDKVIIPESKAARVKQEVVHRRVEELDSC